MAETYEINDPTPEENITLEEEAANIPDEPAETEEGRPEWLPEKFKSPEDMAKAYQNLEQKLSSEDRETDSDEDLPPTEENETTAPADNAVAAASQEWDEKGELSDDTYKSLEKAGLSKEVVDTYIRGQEALQEQQQSEILANVGSREDYAKMTEWAGEELTDNQLEAFNKAVETGSVNEAKMAVDWLKAKYEAANGASPTLVQGRTSGPSSKPFENRAQVLAAMSERDARGVKKYEVDPAYRAEVERRLAISKI